VGMDEANREVADDEPGHAGRRGGISARNGFAAPFMLVRHRVQKRRYRVLPLIRGGQRRGSRPGPPWRGSAPVGAKRANSGVDVCRRDRNAVRRSLPSATDAAMNAPTRRSFGRIGVTRPERGYALPRSRFAALLSSRRACSSAFRAALMVAGSRLTRAARRPLLKGYHGCPCANERGSVGSRDWMLYWSPADWARASCSRMESISACMSSALHAWTFLPALALLRPVFPRPSSSHDTSPGALPARSGHGSTGTGSAFPERSR
jgi:hypothetical protein